MSDLNKEFGEVEGASIQASTVSAPEKQIRDLQNLKKSADHGKPYSGSTSRFSGSSLEFRRAKASYYEWQFKKGRISHTQLLSLTDSGSRPERKAPWE